MSEAIDQILDLGFLGAIARDDLLALRPAPDLLFVKTGETLIRQGETGQAYYLLLRGRLRRFVNDDHGARKFAGNVFPGQGVGASGLLTDEGNATTVRVMHDSEVVSIPRAAFLQMMVLSWEFAISVSREQIERVRAAAAPDGHHAKIKTIAVVPMDTTVDRRRFIDELTKAIAPMASVATADNAFMDQAAPTQAPDAEQPSRADDVDVDAVIDRLEALERTHDIVLYETSPDVDVWTRLIFARADLALLVTSVGGKTDLCGTETTLIEPTEGELLPRIDLVVMHGNDWEPDCRTRDWLDGRCVREWHHLRNGCQQDFQRLARILTGNAIALVLSGGGARALVEIGVFKSLRDAGIPIDRVAGTSMGAAIGGLVASGSTPQDVVEGVRRWSTDGKPGRDYTFPLMALVHGKKLHRATQNLLGDRYIEDLPISFFCISADLSEEKAVVHDRGSLWRSVRASMSVPGIGPPLFDSGRILVDGGVVNNVPADIVANRYAGRIIVVDVSLSQKRVVPHSYNELVPSGWNILWHWINPFLEPLQVPGIYEVLLRSIGVGSRDSADRARDVADLLIRPQVTGVGLLDFRKIDRLVDIGAECTTAALTSLGKDALQQRFSAPGTIQLNVARDAGRPPHVRSNGVGELSSSAL